MEEKTGLQRLTFWVFRLSKNESTIISQIELKFVKICELQNSVISDPDARYLRNIVDFIVTYRTIT